MKKDKLFEVIIFAVVAGSIKKIFDMPLFITVNLIFIVILLIYKREFDGFLSAEISRFQKTRKERPFPRFGVKWRIEKALKHSTIYSNHIARTCYGGVDGAIKCNDPKHAEADEFKPIPYCPKSKSPEPLNLENKDNFQVTYLICKKCKKGRHDLLKRFDHAIIELMKDSSLHRINL